jgi:long-subunit fatty acid transport protein
VAERRDKPKTKGAKQMIKLALTTAVAVVAFGATAFAAGFSVTEISTSGIKRANGTWTVSTEGDKVSGKADMQLDNGSVVTYKIDGKLEGGVYTLNLNERSDGKKDCVWTGKANQTGKVYEGPVQCGGEKFSIRAGVQ